MSASHNAGKMLELFLKTSDNIILHLDKEDRDQKLSELQEIFKRSCQHATNLKKIDDLVKELSKSNSKEDDVVTNITKVFGEHKDDICRGTPDVSKDPNFLQFINQVKELVNNEDGASTNRIDDDLEMQGNEINVIDPFTKKRMTDPVKNKECGHVYDKPSVISILQMNKNTRCPVVGCASKKYIESNDLCTDIVTKTYLQRHQA